MAGRLLELRHEMQIGLLYRIRGEHLDLGGRRLPVEPEQRNGNGDDTYDVKCD
jgi:hypothetical protein